MMQEALDSSLRILALVRHGESEWNAKNVWTGLVDVGLTEKGKEEAKSAARLLLDVSFDVGFTSRLKRATESLRIIVEELHVSNIPIFDDPALNERNYGVYTGKNKLEIKAQLGDAEFLKLRRGWDYPIQNGESLKQVYDRVIPYYEKTILPKLIEGKNVLVVAHGNSLRALMKNIEHISDTDIPFVELATGEIVLYYVDQSGTLVRREKRMVHHS